MVRRQFGKWLKQKVEKDQSKPIISIFEDIEKNPKKGQDILCTIIWGTVQRIAKYSTASKSGYFSIHLYEVSISTFIQELKNWLDENSTPTISFSFKNIDPEKLNHFRKNDYQKGLTVMKMFRYFLNQSLFKQS